MRGSVVLAMLLHATVNTMSTGLIFPFFSGATLILLWWICSVFWLCAGLAYSSWLRNETNRRSPFRPSQLLKVRSLTFPCPKHADLGERSRAADAACDSGDFFA